jgi:hypothetical protein
MLPALALTVQGLDAAELQPRTVAAFDRYAAATERRIDGELTGQPFVYLDALDTRARADWTARLRNGEPLIERLTTRESGREIEIPAGLVHHWVGLVFVPGATVEEAVGLLQDYDRAADIYRPRISRSKLVARQGDRFSVYLRFFMEKVISVTLDSEHDAQFFRPGADRAYSRIVSTRIVEVTNPGTRQEAQRPVGDDGGYLWRLNTYWRFLGRDGGVYVQCESLSLTRSIPVGFRWLIGPFVTSIPRESLTFTMQTTRDVLARPAS